MKSKISKSLVQKYLLFVVVFLSLAIVFVIGFISQNKTDHKGAVLSQAQTAKYAAKILEKCKDIDYKPGCYDREIPKLMNEMSMEDAFRVTRAVKDQDQEYLYCHTLSHRLSEAETRRDPSKWKEVITRCPTAICNNGCLHGAIIERFKNEYLTEEQIEAARQDLKVICDPRENWDPSKVDVTMCYHGMGHLVMYMTKANISKSLDLCKSSTANKKSGPAYFDACIGGVIMQVFQAQEPEDVALVKDMRPRKEDVESFCRKNFTDYYNDCMTEAWALESSDVKTPEGVTDFCSFSNDSLVQKSCFASILTMITTNLLVNNNDLESFKEFCLGLPKSRWGECFAIGASRIIQFDSSEAKKAISVCNAANEGGVEDECYNELLIYSTWSYKPGSKEFADYCNLLPGDFRTRCLKT
jgi:hypothetical protein